MPSVNSPLPSGMKVTLSACCAFFHSFMHEGVVDRHAYDFVDPVLLEGRGQLVVARHVRGRAGRREGARQGEDNDGLACEDVIGGHVDPLVTATGVEGDLRDAASDTILEHGVILRGWVERYSLFPCRSEPAYRGCIDKKNGLFVSRRSSWAIGVCLDPPSGSVAVSELRSGVSAVYARSCGSDPLTDALSGRSTGRGSTVARAI